MYSADIAAVWLTLKLATVVTALLLVIGTPVAWWIDCAISISSSSLFVKKPVMYARSLVAGFTMSRQVTVCVVLVMLD